jgi:hypothetical protein
VAQPPVITATKVSSKSAPRGGLTDARLERAALRLAEQADPRGVITLVERWAQTGEPTERARLAQIEALLDLGMTDRAWTRLQDDLADAGTGPEGGAPTDADARLERLRLTARMFVDRGWPKRAQPVLDEALTLAPDDEGLLALRARAQAPARRPPPDDAVGPDAAPAEHVALAEACLATGAFLRARRVLEALAARAPADAAEDAAVARRADDLLWALRGDYDVADTLADLVDATEDLDLAPDHDEHTDATAHVSPRAPRPAPPLPRPTGEPALDPADLGVSDLFGMAPAGGEPDDGRPGEVPEAPGEITQATRMLDLRSGEGAMGGGDRDEDTQVLRVFSNPAASVATPEPAPPSGRAEDVEREDEAVVQLTATAAAVPPPTVAMPRPIPTPPRASTAYDAPPPVPDVPVEPMVLLDDAQIAPLEAEPLLPGWAKLLIGALLLGAIALIATAVALG